MPAEPPVEKCQARVNDSTDCGLLTRLTARAYLPILLEDPKLYLV